MGYRNGKLDMSHPFPAHLLLCYFNSTAVANDATITDSLVFAAMALIVLGRTEDLLAEETVPFRLICPVIDGFRLQDLS